MDFVLELGIRVAIELDGKQHFAPIPHFHKTARAFRTAVQRDLAKEDTLLAQGTAVVRILQEDIYHDRHNWRTWITKAVAKAEADAEAGAPPRRPPPLA